MTPTHHLPNQVMRSQRDFVISYTQSDVDTIRNQVEQTEASKRRWMILTLIAIVAMFVSPIQTRVLPLAYRQKKAVRPTL